MKAYPNEKLYTIAKENYDILQGYCAVLEEEGYWQHPQMILKRRIEDFLALYVQALLVQVADYIKAEDAETLRMIAGVTKQNPLAVDEMRGISGENAAEAKKLVSAPPILLQLCSLRDVENHSSMTGLFFDAVLNIIFSAAYLNRRNLSDEKMDSAVTRYVREYYGRIQVFIQGANSRGACVDEQYIFHKICMGDLESNTALLKEAGEDFAGYKKDAFFIEEKIAPVEKTSRSEKEEEKQEKETVPEGASAVVNAQEHWREDVTDSGDGYGYSEDAEEEEEEYTQDEYEAEDELVCAAELLAADRRKNETAGNGSAVMQEEENSSGACEAKELAQEEVKAVPEQMPEPSVDKEAATRAALASFKAKRMEKLMNRLDELVGLAGVKGEIRSLINLIRVRKMREEYHLPGMPMSYHMVFTGNPGTGKTTVARLIGEIYRELGILSKGMMIETDRAGLVAGYVGQTALKVKEVVDRARGGILFIDEAYTLSNAVGGNDFGTEAIDMLVKLMEDYRDDLVIIVAGYTEEMENFLKSNTGLISRFNKFIDFPDYSDDELLDILFGMAKKAGFCVEKEVGEAVRGYLARMASQERADFGNARGIRNLFEKLVAAQANRVVEYVQPTKEQLSSITFEDCSFFA